MKTKEELEVLKEEYKKLKNKLAELTEDELKQVSGGIHIPDEALESPGISGTSDSDVYTAKLVLNNRF